MCHRGLQQGLGMYIYVPFGDNIFTLVQEKKYKLHGYWDLRIREGGARATISVSEIQHPNALVRDRSC